MIKRFIEISVLLTIVSLAPSAIAQDALAEITKKYSQKVTHRDNQTVTEEKKPTVEVKEPKKQASAEVFEKGFTWQVASYEATGEADAHAARFSKKGLTTAVKRAVVKGKPRFRVNVGQFKTAEEAEQFRTDHPKMLSKAILKKVEYNSVDRDVASAPSAKPSVAKKKKEKMPPPPAAPVEATQTPEQASAAQPPAAQPAEEAEAEDPHLLGDWGGARTKLKESGLDVGLKYKYDAFQSFGGGVQRNSSGLGNLDLTGDFDLEKLLGIPSVNLWLYGIYDHGDHPIELTGSSFPSSNIEAPTSLKLYEAYLTISPDDRFNLLVGMRDLNADFYATDTSGAFLHSSFGISPALSQTGVNGPSIFPTPALAVTAKYSSPTSFYFETGAFNARAGNPDDPKGTHVYSGSDEGQLLITETGCSGETDGMIHKYAAGIWSYSKRASTQDTTRVDDQNYGFYFLLDQSLSKYFSVFAKYGEANPAVNQFATTYEAGFALKSPIAGRPDDKFAAGVAQAIPGADYKNINNSEVDETTFEVNYQFDFGNGLKITPDFQYITNPGLSRSLDDVNVGMMRFEFNF